MTRAAYFLLLVVALVTSPTQARAWWDDSWSARQKVTLDAGASGAALAEDAGRMPVLLRLHDGDFNFADAQPDGHDLRIIGADDKTPMKFQIEQWSPAAGIGLIWVDVPSVKAGAAQSFYIYSGNAKAPPPDAGGFDADVVLAYHFGESGGPAKDSSGKGNNAQNSVPSISDAVIGSGAQFDGASSLAVRASPSLAFPAGSAFTFTTWVRSDKAGPNQMLYSGGGTYSDKSSDGALIVGLDQGAPFVEVRSGSSVSRSDPQQPIPNGEWHHIAVVVSDRTTLYVDGKALWSGAATLPNLTGAATLGAGLIGAMDEVEISKSARSSGYIAAAYATQSGPDNRFMSLDQEEKTSSFNGGYFGVILRSVTIDGWVVIAILGVMSVISWIVMIQKTRLIQRVARGNHEFLKLFESTGGRFSHDGTEAIGRRARDLHTSCIYRIYEEGVKEIRLRIGDRDGAGAALSAQAIVAIRASLDRIYTREGQRLNAGIVLLTIAISGGPFVGLLGTVVGVMITFAAIAASGDVNVNAIAPGIAAALVATCAGMAVAIPSLFGYNYLVTRIKDLTADMHVFMDEFSTKLAEQFSPEQASERLPAE